MRFLVDECINKRIVERLLAKGHDVSWIAEIAPSNADGSILDSSWEESRIMFTADWDFGELAIRKRRPALGIVLVAMPQVARHVDKVVGTVVQRVRELEKRLEGKLTIIEPGRVRQRPLERDERR
jgi:predicted nuclease of predicted toxin-antitoxin system